jgi:Uncharacterised nucleotidyltransferase
MRRNGLTGDVWPDGIQEQLLRAALLPGADGAAAWRAVRHGIDIDHLPGELHRLIPLLSKALAARGVDEPELPRLKGVYQFSWYRNQLLFAEGGALLAALEGAGVSTMVLRGAAMSVAHYRDTGVRPMNDLDVLVRASELDRARRTAEAEGWWPVAGSEPLERREAAAALRNQHGRVVRLHWQPSRNLSLPGALPEAFPEAEWEPMWQRSVGVTFHHTATRVPSAADHLVHACLDGARANSGSTLRWITDATGLLRAGPDLDWEVVVAEARRHRVSLLVGEALRYLVEAFQADVPPDAMKALATAPTTRRERLAHRLCLTTTPRVASAAEVLGRFTRLTADLPLRRAVGTAPAFLAAMLAVDRRRDLPVAAARKAVRAVFAPTPPLASLSMAGPPRPTNDQVATRHRASSPSGPGHRGGSGVAGS